jgi:glycosyltransferase involved in cell wall biosynthesis
MSRKNKPECRVLQVFSRLGVGGAEVWLMALLRYFRDSRNDLPVRLKIDVLLTGGPGEFDEEAQSLGTRLFYVPYSRRKLHRFIPAFREVLTSGRYHAIHDHQDYAAGMHFLFGFGELPPIRMVHVHNPAMNIEYFSSSFLRRSVLFAGKSLVGRFATHILGTSRQLLTEYGFDDKPFSRLPRQAAHCGFDVNRYRGDSAGFHAQLRREFGWNDSAKLILFVGRLDSNCNQKNPDFALAIAKLCAAKDPNIRMLIVGGGDEIRERLEAQTASWGLTDRIRFAGVRSDVPRLMLGSDVLLFPSVAEGLGMVVVEAQAAGLRVVASDTTPRECVVVADGIEFLSLSDGAEQWSETVLHTLNRPSLDKEECNVAVRSSAFSIDESAATLLNIYQGTICDQMDSSNSLRVEWAGNETI